MTGKIYHPENKHPEGAQQDLAPDASKGLNYGNAGPDQNLRTALEVKDAHNLLSDFQDDELREIPILGEGSRLKTGAKYINLRAPVCVEFQAQGTEDVASGDLFVPKAETPYELWNRLLGVQHPRRAK